MLYSADILSVSVLTWLTVYGATPPQGHSRNEDIIKQDTMYCSRYREMCSLSLMWGHLANRETFGSSKGVHSGEGIHVY